MCFFLLRFSRCNMNRQVLKQIKSLVSGNLVRVEWYDASVGESFTGGTETIDVPVQSGGICMTFGQGKLLPISIYFGCVILVWALIPT